METTPVNFDDAFALNYVMREIFKTALGHDEDDKDAAGPDYGGIIASQLAEDASGLTQFQQDNQA